MEKRSIIVVDRHGAEEVLTFTDFEKVDANLKAKGWGYRIIVKQNTWQITMVDRHGAAEVLTYANYREIYDAMEAKGWRNHYFATPDGRYCDAILPNGKVVEGQATITLVDKHGNEEVVFRPRNEQEEYRLLKPRGWEFFYYVECENPRLVEGLNPFDPSSSYEVSCLEMYVTDDIA